MPATAVGEGNPMIDAVRDRRSIRRYEDRPVEPALIEELQEAVLRAPSSRNLKPWRFIFATDKAMLQALAHAKASFGEFVGDAPLAVVVCADASVSDCWIEDCSIAAATLQLAATDLGLGTCWIQIRARQHANGSPAEEHVRKTLDLPKELSVLCIVSVGHPAENKPPRDLASLSWEKISLS
jgi:nitroreductase